MNSRKAKNLRALVNHLMSHGAVAQADWHAYAPGVYVTDQVTTRRVSKYHNETGVETSVSHARVSDRGSVRLNPSCGRAIYQAMKKRALGTKPR